MFDSVPRNTDKRAHTAQSKWNISTVLRAGQRTDRRLIGELITPCVNQPGGADVPHCPTHGTPALPKGWYFYKGPRANKDWTLKNSKNQWAEAGARQTRVGHNIRNENPKISYWSRWNQPEEVSSISSSYGNGNMTSCAHQKYKLQVSQDNFTLSKKEL